MDQRNEPIQLININTHHQQIDHDQPDSSDQSHANMINNNQSSSSRTSSTPQNIATRPAQVERWELDSIKNGIIVLCSLFASFCFEAILNPPGGVWQSSNILNTSNVTQIETQSVPDVHSLLMTTISIMGGRIPKLNLTDPELFGPGKAMSVALYPRQFVSFLLSNSLCFLTSVLTVVLVMLTTSFEAFFPGGLVPIMTLIVVGSAVGLYRSVLVLVTDEQFAVWAFAVGAAPMRIALILFGIYKMATSSSLRRGLNMIFVWIAMSVIRILGACRII